MKLNDLLGITALGTNVCLRLGKGKGKELVGMSDVLQSVLRAERLDREIDEVAVDVDNTLVIWQEGEDDEGC